MSSITPLVAGNWKLNGSRESVRALAKAVAAGAKELSCDVLICPVVVHIQEVSTALGSSTVSVGAQNCCDNDEGAYTGEIAAPMLKEYGCSHVIVGHSERRAIYGESSQLVAQKTAAVIRAGLIPIVCIGETLDQRESGLLQSVIDEQLDAVIDVVGVSGFANLVIAYEPVWAIGTGKSASSEQAQEVHAMIRKKLQALDASVSAKTPILYGGSVKPANAAELFSQPDIDGGLIGGAALDAESFLAICQAAR